MNVQLITGFNVAPGHWPYSTFEPLVVIISVVMLSNFQLLSKIISFIENKPTSITAMFSTDKLNPVSKKQLIKDLNRYYSSSEIYILITKNINLANN